MREGGLNFREIAEHGRSALPSLMLKWGIGGARRGNLWLGPVKTPRFNPPWSSLVIWLNKGCWVHYASGEKGGDVTSLYAHLRGISQGEAAKELAAELGLDPSLPKPTWRAPAGEKPTSFMQPPGDDQEAKEQKRRRDFARKLWADAGPVGGTLAETYMRRRGLTFPLPKAFRFARMKHAADQAMHPCMVAGIKVEDRITGIHRTWLDEAGRKAEIWWPDQRVAPSKQMLGTADGGSVRFNRISPFLVLAEGIETAATVMQLVEGWTVWAALSAGNIAKIAIPPQVQNLVVVCDGDKKLTPRWSDWHRTGLRAAEKALDVHRARGLEVDIIHPGDGLDLNDLIRPDEPAANDPEKVREFVGLMEGKRRAALQEVAA